MVKESPVCDETLDNVLLELEKILWSESHNAKVYSVNTTRALVVDVDRRMQDLTVTNEALVQELSKAAYKLNLYKDKYGEI